MTTRITVTTVVGFIAMLPAFGLTEYVGHAAAPQKPKSRTEIATLSRLPSLGSNAEAHAVNQAGTVVVGHSFDRADLLYAVKWTQQNGIWQISTLPYPGSAVATGIDDQGNIVGYGATFPRRPILWPAGGGYTVLGCASDVAEAHAISADGQVIVGQASNRATAWQAPQSCTEDLPPLEPGRSAAAHAVNGDGTIIGGSAALTALDGQQTSMAVRWIGPQGGRQIELLDSRPGVAQAANAGGDLAGHVTTACSQTGGCLRGVIWYAAGGYRDLATLGGSDGWIRDINAAGEAVGISTAANGTNTAFFWSQAVGMLQLPANRWGGANAVSDVRSDGTRLVAGIDAQANAVVWLVRNP
jgi:probable HAF family extracellular repeat protein